MTTSEIRFHVELDENRVPDKIFWEATESPTGKLEETKAMSVAVWDSAERTTLRIDLWAKEMPAEDLKLMMIDIIHGNAETVKRATGDTAMGDMMLAFCRELEEHIVNVQKQQQQIQ
jgi:gliding motility-associated protein GldC